MVAYRNGEESNPESPGGAAVTRSNPNSGDAEADTHEAEVMDGYPEYWIG